MRRKRSQMSPNRHLHNILGGLRRRGMSKAERDKVHHWLAPLAAFGCVYCKTKIKPHAYSLDHRMPLSKGGLNTAENLVICCKRCNCAKGSLVAEDYLALLEGLKVLSIQGRANVLARLRAAGKWYRK